ncbi:hypothetical protein EDB87DRAFT_275694 [Lactarius vividus]|nr:hypothetical protein EDB87DRAFT_275694 [Lactarius vividus]
MECLHQIRLIPDVLPVLQPIFDSRVAFRRPHERMSSSAQEKRGRPRQSGPVNEQAYPCTDATISSVLSRLRRHAVHTSSTHSYSTLSRSPTNTGTICLARRSSVQGRPIVQDIFPTRTSSPFLCHHLTHLREVVSMYESLCRDMYPGLKARYYSVAANTMRNASTPLLPHTGQTCTGIHTVARVFLFTRSAREYLANKCES